MDKVLVDSPITDHTTVPVSVKILPAWLVYSVFGVVFLAFLVILDIPWPFSNDLYRFESDHLAFLLSPAPFIAAILVLTVYAVYFFLRIFVRTSIKPMMSSSVPLFERLLLGPLTLSSLMFVIAAKVYPLLAFHKGEVPSISAALAISAYLSSFTIGLFLFGMITFSLAQTRKRYTTMFIISVGFVVLMPIISGFMAQIGDSVGNAQLKKGYQEASLAKNMTDCAEVQTGHPWVACIVKYMNSRADYDICLSQAPSKDFIDQSTSSMLCDREFESLAKNYSFAMKDCNGLTSYRAWHACMNSAFKTADDYASCVEQSTSMMRDHEKGPATNDCTVRYAVLTNDFDLCNTMTDIPSKFIRDYSDCTLPLINTFSTSTDPQSCFLPKEIDWQRKCLARLLLLNKGDKVVTNNICQLFTESFPFDDGGVNPREYSAYRMSKEELNCYFPDNAKN